MARIPLEWEGTWDEIASNAHDFTGRRLRLMVLPSEPVASDPRLRVLQEIETRSQAMDPRVDIQDYLREGRSGAMFGPSCNE